MVTETELTENEELPLTERVVKISRVAKVVKGGRNLSFNAMVVVGDFDKHVGIGMGKASDVPDAVKKGAANARKNLISIPLKGTSIPHEITTKFGGSLVMLKPASPGTGIIAGSAVRALMEQVGIQNILTKRFGSNNQLNVTKATMKALSNLKDVVSIANKRGITIKEVFI